MTIRSIGAKSLRHAVSNVSLNGVTGPIIYNLKRMISSYLGSESLFAGPH